MAYLWCCLEHLAAQLGGVAGCAYGRLLVGPQEEDRRRQATGHAHLGGRQDLRRGRSTVKRYAAAAREGRLLAPKKRPGSKPKMDEGARRLLERDMKERPAATLPQRREFLRRACGLEVSDSTVSRMLRRLGWSRKKDRWERANATGS